jgi:Tol biopolymer transport system component/DNA-binding winged helix-turn-helix (wHTH) protein
MEIHKARPGYLAFDQFEVDLTSGRLLKNGRRIRLQPQPFRMLELMLQRPGELITREEVCRALWHSDTFVDFDHSLGTAINKIREALEDSAENPKFIETIPRRGYQFIGKLTTVSPARETPPLPHDLAAERTNGHALPQALTSAVALPHFLATSPAPVRSSVRRAASVIAIAALVVAAVFLALRWSQPGRERSFADVRVSPFTALPGDEMSPAFSPDGSRIAFAWNGAPQPKTSGSEAKGFDLYVKALGQETLLRLTNHPSGWISPAWSPDGTQIAFHRMAGPDTGIYVVSALGGPERKLHETHIPYDVTAPISWSPDGKWIAFDDSLPEQSVDRMYLLSPDTLETIPIPHNPSCLHEAMPTFSHRGDLLAYLCVHSLIDLELDVVVPFQWQPNKIGTIVGAAPGVVWTTDDQRLIVSHGADDGGVLDEFTVRDGSIRRLNFARSAIWPTISPARERLAYSSSSDIENVYRRDLAHPALAPVALGSTTREQENPQYSPDGKRIAFASSRAGNREIWVSDLAGANLLRLSDLKGYATRPQWSPDGQKIVFGTHQGQRHEIFIVNAAEGLPRRLETNVLDISMPSWSRDGKWIYFRSFEALGHKIYRCPATGGDATVLRTGHDGTSPQESPDGKTLYFTARNANTALMSLSLNGNFAESTVTGMPPINNESQWVVVPGGVYFVPVEALKSLQYFDFKTKKSRLVFENQVPLADGLSVSPDGRWLLYSQTDEENTDIMLADRFR